jgi:ribonuclease VapC
MIADTSAIVAILRMEAEAAQFSEVILDADTCRISAASYLEVGIVIDGERNPVASARVDELIEEFDIIIDPVSAEQARRARQAYRDFGKGSGHAAQLNFGDCFAYALATDLNQPLLYKGNDFTHTGIRRA